MASFTVNAKRLGSGKLFRGVTSAGVTAGTAPYGGTALGGIRAAEVRFGLYLRLTAEETNSPSAVLFLGDQLELRIVSMGWDADARAALFPNVSSGNPLFPGSTLSPGAPLAELTNVLFAPEDATMPAVLLNKCVAVPDPGIPLGGRGGAGSIVRKSSSKYLDVEAALVGVPDGSDNVGMMAPLASLTVP